MSIFGDVNFDEGSDNPFGIEPGTYEVSISEATIERSAKENLGLWLTFSSEDGKTIRKWTTMPEPDQDEATRKRNTSFLRLMLRNLEIPEDKWSKLAPDDFIGLDCVIVVTPQSNNPEYNQVKKITRSRGQGTYRTDSSTAYGDSDSALAELLKKGEAPAGGGLGF